MISAVEKSDQGRVMRGSGCLNKTLEEDLLERWALEQSCEGKRQYIWRRSLLGKEKVEHS